MTLLDVFPWHIDTVFFVVVRAVFFIIFFELIHFFGTYSALASFRRVENVFFHRRDIHPV